MSDLIDDPTPGQNAPEFSVSEISGAVKRMVEGEFGRVRVKGEVGRVVWARSGHLYFDLKDDRAVLAAVSWKGQAARLPIRPEEGMEVVATGKLTTFPGQSKYQMIVDDVRPAGVGALMAMLEKRKKALAAEGLFAADRKKPIPYLPRVIGVVTSPTGAVIRDILHRLRDRFPREVLIWPVAVQGDRSAAEVAAAIKGFNALTAGGAIPRPDLLIVARGGGSIEDLWGFNEDIVVRAVAASDIPLISAVGHETDTTLIDYVADQRAPTPTAAAELAVPVRADLQSALMSLQDRRFRTVATQMGARKQRLRDLGRALPRPQEILAAQQQRFDHVAMRLGLAAQNSLRDRRVLLERAAARVQPYVLKNLLDHKRLTIDRLGARLDPALSAGLSRRRDRFLQSAARLGSRAILVRIGHEGSRVQAFSSRLQPAFRVGLERRTRQLQGLERMRQTLGYRQTLARGYALVRDGENQLVTSQKAATRAARLSIEFHDGTYDPDTPPQAKKKTPPKGPEGKQGQLF